MVTFIQAVWSKQMWRTVGGNTKIAVLSQREITGSFKAVDATKNDATREIDLEKKPGVLGWVEMKGDKCCTYSRNRNVFLAHSNFSGADRSQPGALHEDERSAHKSM